MAYVTSLTSERMLEIEAKSIVSGHINTTGDLILISHSGQEFNAGHVYGASGTGVTSVTPFYLQQGKGGNPPSAPMVLEPSIESPWKLDEPDFVDGTDLWITTRVVYSDNTFQYTRPVRSSAYTGIGQAATMAIEAQEKAIAADLRSTQAYEEAISQSECF